MTDAVYPATCAFRPRISAERSQAQLSAAAKHIHYNQAWPFRQEGESCLGFDKGAALREY